MPTAILMGLLVSLLFSLAGCSKEPEPDRLAIAEARAMKSTQFIHTTEGGVTIKIPDGPLRPVVAITLGFRRRLSR